MRACSLYRLCGLLVLALAAFDASAQSILHNYELGVEVNGSVLQLDIYRADTGEPLWSGLIEETGGDPDVQFDTNGLVV